MQAFNYSTARNSLKSLINDVCDNYEPVIITSKDNKNVVMLSLEEFNSLQEQAFILSKPKDAQEILNRMADIEQGIFSPKDLL